MEGRLAHEGEWSLLAEVFPDLRWELVLVGPEMSDLFSESVVADGGRGRVHARGVGMKGHEWAAEASTPPDLVVCFNSGIGTLALPLVRHWLATVAALLRLDVPVLFTCFGAKERQGETAILRHLFRAKVLVDFLDNPLKPLPEDRPTRHVRAAELTASIAEVEHDNDVRICNAVVWWAKGSELSGEELQLAAEVKGPQLLKELTQSFAVKGAYKGWTESLSSGGREIGDLALESFAAALENPEIAKALSKVAKRVIDAIVQFTKRHGQRPEARLCIERLLFERVRIALGADADNTTVLDMVRQTIDEQYGDILGPSGDNATPPAAPAAA